MAFDRHLVEKVIRRKLELKDQFIELLDTPDSYSGKAGKPPRVKSTEDGLEFEAAIPALHKTSHQNGGVDEINITDLSGELADLQKPNLTQGLDANKPAAGIPGRLYFATDTKILYRDSGTAWEEILKRIPAHTELTDKEVGGVIDHADGSIITAKLGASAIVPAKIKTRAAVGLGDADATLTAAQMVDSSIFTITPTVARVLTTDTAANIVAALPGYVVGTWFDFTIIVNAAFNVTLSAGVDITIVGNAIVNNASGTFRGRVDSATTITIYRIT